MSDNKVKHCPFNHGECNADCALFIDNEELNELLAARLSSLGVLNKDYGCCSFKTIAMSAGRYIFENTSTKRF